jgi:hypothetical protein
VHRQEAMRDMLLVTGTRKRWHWVAVGTAAALLIASCGVGLFVARCRLPRSYSGTYALEVFRGDATSQAGNSDRELIIGPTGMTSRRLDNGATERLEFQCTKKAERDMWNRVCHVYVTGTCIGSLCRQGDGTLLLTACTRGEEHPCTNPKCYGFAGLARKK